MLLLSTVQYLVQLYVGVEKVVVMRSRVLKQLLGTLDWFVGCFFRFQLAVFVGLRLFISRSKPSCAPAEKPPKTKTTRTTKRNGCIDIAN